MLRLTRLRDYLRSSLWFVPMLLVFAFVVLAAVLAYLDSTVVSDWGIQGLYQGTATGARTVLSTIAASMLSLAVLVFSITLVVLQLASTQLTPRVITLFLQDRWSKFAMGVFLGTFAYSLSALWLVTAPTESYTGFVPVLMVTVALVLVGVSVLVFINYVHRVSQSIRVEAVTREITERTIASVEATLPRGSDEEDEQFVRDDDGDARLYEEVLASEGYEIPAPRTGTVVGVSPSAALHWAQANDAVVHVLVPLGTFVTEGLAVVRVHDHEEPENGFPIEDVVSVGDERSVSLDPAYGLRQLIDIALRALSPGINEPGTAVIVLDHIHEILQRVGSSALPGPVYRDDEGEVRAVVPRFSWDGWLSLALREILDYGAESVQVCTRVRALVDGLGSVLPPSRHAALRRYAEEISGLPGSQRRYLEWVGLTRSDR